MLLSISSKYSYYKPAFNYTRKTFEKDYNPSKLWHLNVFFLESRISSLMFSAIFTLQFGLVWNLRMCLKFFPCLFPKNCWSSLFLFGDVNNVPKCLDFSWVPLLFEGFVKSILELTWMVPYGKEDQTLLIDDEWRTPNSLKDSNVSPSERQRKREESGCAP